MASAGLINPNPTVYQVSEIVRRELLDLEEGEFDGFDSLEIFGTLDGSRQFSDFYSLNKSDIYVKERRSGIWS